jgi:hypothetical protein
MKEELGVAEGKSREKLQKGERTNVTRDASRRIAEVTRPQHDQFARNMRL